MSDELDALRAAAIADPDVPERVRQFLADGAPLERIALDPFGRWTYRGQPVEHSRVAALFHRSLERTAAGTWVLSVPPYVHPVVVEGAGRFLDRLSVAEGDWIGTTPGAVTVRLEAARLVTDGDAFLGALVDGDLYRFVDNAHRDVLAMVDVDVDGDWVATTPRGTHKLIVLDHPLGALGGPSIS